ncbi:MAG: TIGR04282 family arsenosugar biosynthesis glycosyltransferase [Ignavibacteria bacterium]|nr:TIGR04282 family arsenosugar biosynthesis glycosyltransferase [Ignavibacteria bacterium]
MNALIIFARYPEPGRVKTRLGAVIGMEQAAGLYREFARNAFSIGTILETKRVAVYLFYPPGVPESSMRGWIGKPFRYRLQTGEGLGERMENAFRTTFNEGATASVIIGTDVPELEVETVWQAFGSLSTHDFVVGPCSDGGYYLLGMKEPREGLFTGVQWSTGEVLASTYRKIRELKLSYVDLRIHEDIDTIEDYEAYRTRRP